MRAFACMTVVLGTVLVGGCVDFSQPHPAQAQFGLRAEPSARGDTPGASRSGALRVARVRVAAPSDGRMFVYRVGEREYQRDYFNLFVADPDSMLTAGLVESLGARGPFASVVEPGGGADASKRLETTVTAMHADLRPGRGPAAHISARFVLLEDAGGATRVVHEWTLTRDEALASSSADEIAAGFGRAWGGLLEELATGLAATQRE